MPTLSSVSLCAPFPTTTVIAPSEDSAEAKSIVSRLSSPARDSSGKERQSEVVLPSPNAADTRNTALATEETTFQRDNSRVPELFKSRGGAFLHCLGRPRVDHVKCGDCQLLEHLEEFAENGDCRRSPGSVPYLS